MLYAVGRGEFQEPLTCRDILSSSDDYDSVNSSDFQDSEEDTLSPVVGHKRRRLNIVRKKTKTFSRLVPPPKLRKDNEQTLMKPSILFEADVPLENSGKPIQK
jgi:hypothetical protein